MTIVVFEIDVQCDALPTSCQVRVVGSCRSLGYWRPHKAPIMCPAEASDDQGPSTTNNNGLTTSKYKLEVRLEQSEYVPGLEYKYVITFQDKSRMPIWIQGENLKLPIPQRIEQKDGLVDIQAMLTDSADVLGVSEQQQSEQEVLSAVASREKIPGQVQQVHAPAPAPAPAPVPAQMETQTQQTVSPPMKSASSTELMQKFLPPLRSVSGKSADISQSDSRGPVPSWYRDGVMYQLFPLGSPGQKSNQGGCFGNVPERLDLHNRQPVERFLQIRKWYDYFEELQIDIVYFCPIFESGTHGYDTFDYYKIDPRLGTNDTFRTILDELHTRGIKVILDGVFNHTGRHHFAFQDILNRGRDYASSPYFEWYNIKPGSSSFGDPFGYQAWSGCQELPRLKLSHPDVRAHLFHVAKYWLEFGIDGWRLDCAHEMPADFWFDFRKACSEVSSNYVLMAETIHGDYNTWVGPEKGLCHSCSNYQIYKPMWSSLKDRNFYELVHCFQRAYEMYPGLILCNFLSNQDVARIGSILESVRQLKIAMTLLFTLPGVPMLYYGDEYGVKGRKEDGDSALRVPLLNPENRDALWTHDEKHMLATTMALIQLKKKFAHVFSRGDYHLIMNTNTLLCFARTYSGNEPEAKSKVALVLMNCAETAATMNIDLKSKLSGIRFDELRFRDAFKSTSGSQTFQDYHASQGSLSVEMPAMTAQILLQA